MSGTIRSQSDLTDNLFKSGQIARAIIPKRFRDAVASAFNEYATEQTADYTAQLTDQGTTVCMNSDFSVMFTVPPNAEVPFPIGATIDVRQTGAGQVRVAPGAVSGITLVSSTGAFSTRAPSSKITLTQQSINNWVIDGDVSEPHRFVIGDALGQIWGSNDGQHWSTGFFGTPIFSDITAPTITDIKWVPELGIFACVDFLGYFHTSSDGINWTTVSVVKDELDSLAYRDGVWVAGQDTMSRNIWRSVDGGQTWQQINIHAGNTPNGEYLGAFLDIENFTGTFVAATDTFSRIYTSPDGLTWTENTLSYWGSWMYSVAYNPLTGRFAAFSSDGGLPGQQPGKVFISDDGLNWDVSGITLPVPSGVGVIAPTASTCVSGTFYIVTGINNGNGPDTYPGSGHLLYSTDNALTWHDVGDITGASVDLNCIAESGGVFVAAGASGMVYRSLASVVTSISGWVSLGAILGHTEDNFAYAIAARP